MSREIFEAIPKKWINYVVWFQYQLILKCFGFRVSGSELKHRRLNAAVHNSQLATRNTQRLNSFPIDTQGRIHYAVRRISPSDL
jgi:hypothetical protein